VEWRQVSVLASWLHRLSLLGLTNGSRPSEFVLRHPVCRIRSVLSPIKRRAASRQTPGVGRETLLLVDSISFASVLQSDRRPQPAADGGFLGQLRPETRNRRSVWRL